MDGAFGPVEDLVDTPYPDCTTTTSHAHAQEKTLPYQPLLRRHTHTQEETSVIPLQQNGKQLSRTIFPHSQWCCGTGWKVGSCLKLHLHWHRALATGLAKLAKQVSSLTHVLWFREETNNGNTIEAFSIKGSSPKGKLVFFKTLS